MTLVVETESGTDLRSDAAISDVLSRYGLMTHEPALELGGHSFSYFHTDAAEAAKAAAEELRLLPGVAAAYLKPEGLPPS